MIKNISKSTIILTAIISVLLGGCTRINSKHYYKTYTGNYVTIWDDYIIFEKYESKEPPKENYIKLNHDNPYRGLVDVFFKKNDSILIYRHGFENSIDVVFDPDVYKVEVFYATWEDREEFKRRTSYHDTLISIEYSVYENRSVLWPTFTEFTNDSMYIREYPVDNKHFFFFTMDLYDYNDSVFSRYDERFDNRVF